MSEVAVEPVLAKVVHVVGSYEAATEVVIDRGSLDFVKVGDRFVIIGRGPIIHDPDTGEALGTLELLRGHGEVVHVQDRLATIRSTGRRKDQPTKRVLSHFGNVIEEVIAPDIIMPFKNIRLGDQARPM